MKRRFHLIAAILAALSTHRPRAVVLANIAEGQHIASQGVTLEAEPLRRRWSLCLATIAAGVAFLIWSRVWKAFW
jgi:hypothetical protein